MLKKKHLYVTAGISFVKFEIRLIIFKHLSCIFFCLALSRWVGPEQKTRRHGDLSTNQKLTTVQLLRLQP